jgi:streptogramin lyase
MRMRSSTLLLCVASLPLAGLLAGCAGMSTTASPETASGLSIKGYVHGGQQPIVGAHVYLMAAATTGYGAASVSTLAGSSTGLSDTVGAYVLSSSTGSFTITGDYSCTPNTQLYLYALGGNPGINNTTNSASGLLAALGSCPTTGTFASNVPYVFINEVSTVATAYAIAGFAVDATHVAATSTTLGQSDLGNAFLSVPNLETLATGAALTTTPAGNGTVPQSTINTLANILSACINSTGPSSSSCTTLFGAAKSGGSTGTTPTDTATAAINIAHYPGTNVTTLFGLASANPPFAPALSAAPNDWLLALNYNGTGAAGSGLSGAYSIAIDGSGDIWITNVNGGSISKLATTGAPLSPAAGFGTTQENPTGIAIDPSGNAWVTDSGTNSLTEYTTVGAVKGNFAGGGINSPQGVAIDGTGNVWVANFLNTTVSEYNNSGTALSGANGFMGGGTNSSTSIAIDKNGYPWIGNQKPAPGSISKLNTSGTPVSGSAGYIGAGINSPESVAVDSSDNIWVADLGNNSVAELNNSGTAVSTSSGYTGGGLNQPRGLSIDGGGNIWVANLGNSTISELNSSGTALSPSTGFAVGGVASPQAMEIDGAGNIWIANDPASNSTIAAVTELVGAAVPRVTPLSAAIKAGTLGTRP